MSYALYDNNGQTLYRRPRISALIRRWYTERNMALSLEALSDRELKDIGVQRCGILATVREHIWMAGG